MPNTDGSRCALTYDEFNEWLCATWRGFVAPTEAMRGAQQHLDHAPDFHCPYLLNDNRALRGT